MGKFIRPPGYVDYDDIREATTLSDPSLKAGLCPKARGDMTACLDCPDKTCRVGRKINDLMERETAPGQKQFAPPETTVEGAAFIEAINSLKPVQKLIKIFDSLPDRQKRFSRKDALDFLYRYCDEHPELQAKELLEESIDTERRQDYSLLKKHILAGKENGWSDEAGEKTAGRIFADRYAISGKAAMAYVYDLKEQYGEVKRDSVERKTVYTEQQVGDLYESLADTLEHLQEEYDERVDEIQRELDFIQQMKGRYQAMISEIRDMEKTLSMYPASDKTALSDAMESDEPMIDEEDNLDYE